MERKGLLILAPYLVFTSLLSALLRDVEYSTLEIATNQFPWVQLIGANLLSILFCWMVIEVLNLTLLRNKSRQPVNISWVLILSFSIGALKGATTGLFGLGLDAFPTQAIALDGRWIQGGILGVFAIPMLTLSVAKLHQINQKRDVLIADSLRALLSGNLARNDYLREQVSGMKSASLDLLDQLEREAASRNGEAAPLLQAAVENLIKNHVRPISHTIWEDKQRRIPPLNISNLLRSGIRSPNLNPLVTATPLFVALILAQLFLTTPTEAFQRSILMALAPALIAKAYGLLKMRSDSIYFVGFLGSQLLATALGLWLADLLFGSTGSNSFWLAWLATSVLSIQSILMATIGHQVVSQDRNLDKELDNLLAGQKIEEGARSAYSSLVNRDYAQFLHSNVQNQLLVSALAARRADFSDADLKREIERLRHLISNLQTERPTEPEMTAGELLSTLTKRWDGFIVLRSDLEPALTNEVFNRNWVLLEVLNEAVSNSIRHGVASEVTIELRLQGEFIEISVLDNGIGPTKGKPGLGTRINQEITDGNWSARIGPDGGTMLKLRLPMSESYR